MICQKLIADFEALLGPQQVLQGEAVKQRSADWFSDQPCLAGVLLRPDSTQAVSEIMRLCHAAKQPVVTYGGVTGVVRGTWAGPDEVVISTERLNQIEQVDGLGGTLTAQAGVALEKIQQAALAEGWCFPLDLGARGSCTLGGNLATNAGGIRVIRYGMIRQMVLGLEVVLADGRIISSMNRLLKNNAGFDLKQLFIGSEGTLGIITRAVLRLQPQLPSVQTALVAFEDFSQVTQLLKALGPWLGGSLSAYEVMWQSHYRLMTQISQRHPDFLPGDYPFYALIESEGADLALHQTQFEQALTQAFEQGLICDALISQSQRQAQTLWAMREDVDGLVQMMNPLLSYDVSLPLQAMEGYVQQVEQALAERWGDQARCVVFGHLGDGNLHVLVSVGSSDAVEHKAVSERVYAPLKALGGSVSAEHGIGLEKRDYLAWCRGEAEIALMHQLKQTLDPQHLLNRGKVLKAT